MGLSPAAQENPKEPGDVQVRLSSCAHVEALHEYADAGRQQ
jgi:hypothetical protein